MNLVAVLGHMYIIEQLPKSSLQEEIGHKIWVRCHDVNIEDLSYLWALSMASLLSASEARPGLEATPREGGTGL